MLVTGSLLITPVRAAQIDVESSFPALREPAAFGDVADDIWYADAAGLCYVTGLLNLVRRRRRAVLRHRPAQRYRQRQLLPQPLRHHWRGGHSGRAHPPYPQRRGRHSA